MVDQKIIDSVKAYLSSGRTEDEITAAMVNAGYNYSDIREAVSAAKSGAQAPIVIPPAQPMQASSSTPQPRAGSSGFNFGVLLQILYQPRQAFERINGGATLATGIVMFAILALISQVIMQLPTISKIGSSITGILVTVVLGAISLALVGAVSALLAGAFGGKRNISKTIGMLGYGQILGVVQVVVSVVLLMAAGITLASTGITGLAAAAGVSVFFIIVFLVWGFWINGSAVASANETSLGKGIAAYIVSTLGVSMVIGMVSALLVFSWVGAMGAPALQAPDLSGLGVQPAPSNKTLNELGKPAIPTSEVPMFIVEKCTLPNKVGVYNNGPTTLKAASAILLDGSLTAIDSSVSFPALAAGGRATITTSAALEAGKDYYLEYPSIPLIRFGC